MLFSAAEDYSAIAFRNICKLSMLNFECMSFAYMRGKKCSHSQLSQNTVGFSERCKMIIDHVGNKRGSKLPLVSIKPMKLMLAVVEMYLWCKVNRMFLFCVLVLASMSSMLRSLSSLSQRKILFYLLDYGDSRQRRTQSLHTSFQSL